MSTATTTPSWESWGRAWEVNASTCISTLLILVFCPALVFYFYISCTHFDGALSAPLFAFWEGSLTLTGLFRLLPAPSWTAAGLYAAWLALQLSLYYLPDTLHSLFPRYHGGPCLGADTPAGKRLPYQINGLQAWILSHLAFFLGAYVFHLFSPTIIFDYWGTMLWMANILGTSIALFVYIKAYLFPTVPEDRKFSGNRLYDYYMGIELNPRIGRFDFKLFFNGRPGIVAWTLINFSFMAKQYQLYGHVTNAMLIVNLLQALYVVDFFWNERWYLKTVDIHHDHFGWMLAWGDAVWLPYMYTLQAFYLVYNPVVLSTGYASCVLLLGLTGYGLFRWVNNQKDTFRRADGETLIWGKKPSFIPCTYRVAGGTIRESKLLTSGFWGIARHFNYTADLMGAYAYCLACGFNHLLPYFYAIFLTILLIHRCHRDEHRCHYKYGAAWEKYCREVRYRLIPGIY